LLDGIIPAGFAWPPVDDELFIISPECCGAAFFALGFLLLLMVILFCKSNILKFHLPANVTCAHTTNATYMKAATIHEIKQELKNHTPAALAELCIRLARFKKENKELLTYLLFEAHDEQTYIAGVKAEIDESFAQLPHANTHLTKKSLRKILRATNKYVRYTASKTAEVELLLHYCTKLKNSGLLATTGTAINNVYTQQLKKLNDAVAALHEDLQHDYAKCIAPLSQVNVSARGFKIILGKK
jgi:hypothetical protein